MLLVVIVYAILGINDQGIDGAAINAKEVGIALFGPYVLAVELASMLLLAGLVVALIKVSRASSLRDSLGIIWRLGSLGRPAWADRRQDVFSHASELAIR